jgi:hypothetical protein
MTWSSLPKRVHSALQCLCCLATPNGIAGWCSKHNPQNWLTARKNKST